MRSRRAHIALFVLLVALLAVSATAALFALPVLAILALLTAGRYVGEERILARHLVVPRARRAPVRRWRPVRPDGVRSLLARRPRTFRGPPIFAA
ncbi:hypothetical protein OJ997_18020 [Solirubrobacter phytolaccae]|uniref:Uncharacterized protein n=1 Tax=Solirubrobacter phytolaccae TaxID=1404360 RepID=A0A9X3S914_9ACTN|nr:hypothetical protein [Solirubrobacter phytolaccae]MDA0182208.1 hypothetical protein [Solirubrobacter phytolaccae]